jgi:hypothetical protein
MSIRLFVGAEALVSYQIMSILPATTPIAGKDWMPVVTLLTTVGFDHEPPPSVDRMNLTSPEVLVESSYRFCKLVGGYEGL